MKTCGIMTITAMAILAGTVAAQPQPAPKNQPPVVMPNSPPPPPLMAAPKSVCSASDAAHDWECPTCGHHGVCQACEGKDRPCLKKLYRWMFYHPSEPACRACPKCANPCHPPLYAWFPCNSGCSSCANERCTSSVCRLDRNGRWCNDRQRCPKGQVGEFRFIGICKPKMPCTNGSCANGTCGVDAMAAEGPMMGQPMQMQAAPAGTQTGPVMQPATEVLGQPQTTTSYKPDVDGAIANATQKPTTVKRMTTYRPDSVANTMPVLSPDQFRKPQR